MSTTVEEVKEFLDSNIKDETDLNLSHIQTLLKLQKEQQTSLNTKLESLKKETRAILSDSQDQTTKQKQQLDHLFSSLKETENNLKHFSSSTSNNNLLEDLVKLEDQLKTINTAKDYIKALLVASELSAQALDLVQSEPEKAITPYKQLVQFQKYMLEHCKDEEQMQSLCDHLKKAQKRLWEELNDVLSANFKKVLDSLSWPTPIKPPYGLQLRTKLKDFEQAFGNLFILQQSSDRQEDPIAIMVEGLSLRFRFHFETSKPTNRLDKPEWYLTHVKNTISSHIPFLMTTVQPILESIPTDKKIYVKDQFIQRLLEDVTRKLRKSMPELLNQPNYLSHTIHEVLRFDKSLQEEFAYAQYTDLSNVILGNPIWFKTWFQAEKSFAQTRYDDIMMDNQAFDIYAEDDLEKSGDKSVKRTKSAVRLISLLENVTSAYTLVPNVGQKLLFFVDIQLNLLDQYHQRLSKAIDSFEALSLIRSVPVPGALPEAVTGVMTSTETGGTVSALHRLYRWWTSARSIVDVLKFWSEDEFFLDIQYELSQDPSRAKAALEDTQMNSCTIQTKNLTDSSTDILFSNVLNVYQQLFSRIEKIIVKIAMKEWVTEARKYGKKDTWWQTSTETSTTDISDELYRPLQDLRVTFNYLYNTLPVSEFLIIYKKTMKEIEEWYWKHIITQSQFSKFGALQLECDLKQGLWKVGQRWVSKPENFTRQLKEVIQLLNMPLENNDLPSCQELMKSLSDDSKFEFVQKTLATLGIEVLSNGQIRDVLRRRNDLLFSWK